MYARPTRCKMKDGQIGAAVGLMHQPTDQIMAMPDTKHFINVTNDDGSGCVIALVESTEVSDANLDQAMPTRGKFSDHLEATPAPEGFEVRADRSR